MRTPHESSASRPAISFFAAFTIVELAIVILVLSLLMTGAVSFYNANIEQAKEEETYRRLTVLEDAMLYYRRAYGRIPCPASRTAALNTSSFGAEQTTAAGSNCTGATALTGGAGNGLLGVIPTRALQLPDEMAFDGWGNRFTYAVDYRYTLTNAFVTYPITNVTGDLYVYDTTGGNAKSSSSIYVIISHGRNGHGAYSRNGTVLSSGSTNTDELNNCSCTSAGAAGTLDNVFIQKMATRGSVSYTNNYDDITLHKRRSQLFSVTTPEIPPVSTY